MRECRCCVNTSNNPAISFHSNDLCTICHLYKTQFNKHNLDEELSFFESFKNEKVMVGISGGKDSTATLFSLIEMGFRPSAFTFNLGYYPKHIFSRSKTIAQEFQIPHEEIDIRKYVRPEEKMCYRSTIRLYENCHDPEVFRKMYKENRSNYSVKSKTISPYVRVCQICRKSVIQAYYHEAIRTGSKVVVLGMNEWAGLSKNHFSAIRKIKPYHDKPEVYIVHLPFLLQRNIHDTSEILKKIDWKMPPGECLVESNSNSCLLARVTEEKATNFLGFHPDSTRLSREITVGFINKEQAKKALCKKTNYLKSIEEILKEARLYEHNGRSGWKGVSFITRTM